jgi:hypothetical protein
MDIRLLEYNEMKEFYEWAIMKNTYLHYKGKDFAKMGDFEEIRAYEHTDACFKRDEFFRKKYGSFCNKKNMDRIAGYWMNYIETRYRRENKSLKEKDTKKTIRSSDGKRTVGMYPESLRETTFIYNNKYEEKYGYEDHKHLISPSRVFDITEDISGIEKWRKEKGEEEANRIMEESKEIGIVTHRYIENSLKKMSGISHLNSLPLPNVKNNKFHDIASHLGNVFLEKGLKDKLTEIWGMEAHLYYKDLYKGITDLVGVYEGEPCIIDFKCKRSEQRKEWMSRYFCQLAAYGMAHNNLCGTNIKKGVILVVTRDQYFQKFVIKEEEWNKYCKDFTKKLKFVAKKDKEEIEMYINKIDNLQKDFI